MSSRTHKCVSEGRYRGKMSEERCQRLDVQQERYQRKDVQKLCKQNSNNCVVKNYFCDENISNINNIANNNWVIKKPTYEFFPALDDQIMIDNQDNKIGHLIVPPRVVSLRFIFCPPISCHLFFHFFSCIFPDPLLLHLFGCIFEMHL